MEDPGRRLYGVQFHPEVRHTEHGQDILKNFLYKICDIAPTWTPVSIIEEAVARIRAQVGERARGLRPVRRGGLGGGRAPRLQGGGRPTHLHLRRPRAHAQERGRAGGEHLPPPLPRAAGARAGAGAVPGQAGGRDGARSRSARSSARSSSAPSKKNRTSWARPSSWCRAPSTPTSSSRAPARRP